MNKTSFHYTSLFDQTFGEKFIPITGKLLELKQLDGHGGNLTKNDLALMTYVFTLASNSDEVEGILSNIPNDSDGETKGSTIIDLFAYLLIDYDELKQVEQIILSKTYAKVIYKDGIHEYGSQAGWIQDVANIRPAYFKHLFVAYESTNPDPSNRLVPYTEGPDGYCLDNPEDRQAFDDDPLNKRFGLTADYLDSLFPPDDPGDK